MLVIGLLKAAALRHLTRIRLQLAIYFCLLEGSLTENTASWQGERFLIEKPARIAGAVVRGPKVWPPITRNEEIGRAPARRGPFQKRVV